MSKHRVKVNNRKAVLDVLRASGEITVGEIFEKTGISKPTIKTIIDYYAADGLVINTGKGTSTDEGGKRPSLFRFDREYGYVLSLHVGPDFVFTALCDMNADILFSRQNPIEKMTFQQIIDFLAEATREYLDNPWTRDKKLIAVSIGLPGVVDPARGISVFTPHYPKWGQDVPFVETYRDKTGLDCPIHIDGVNRYQAFAEYIKGAARGIGSFIIVDAMDLGLGAGVMVNGRLKRGAGNMAGEIGHMILQADGPTCNCGGKGCFEALVYVRRVVEMLKEGFDGHEDSLIYEGGDNRSVTIDNLFGAAKAGDLFAIEILDHIATWFAIGLNNVIMVNDPQKIIIQGVYTRAGENFLASLKEKIDNLSLPGLNRGVELEYSTLGDERCVIGGACYSIWEFFDGDRVYDRRILEGESRFAGVR